MRKAQWLFLTSLFLGLTACEKVAVWMTPAKQAVPSDSVLAHRAEAYFWRILHQGRYEEIPKADYQLTAAYLKNPHDPKLASRLGFLHLWKITERKTDQDPRITHEVVLARKYFADAVQLDQKNAIYRGFLGDSELVEGQIFQDQREQVKGYMALKQAIAEWPQFNYFTAGYPMSTLSPTSAYFKEALEWQWLTLDMCAQTKMNRQHPDYQPYMKKETQRGPARACWNSPVAPFNFEGFFLNMGDMLVKAGQWEVGIQIYKNARLARNYALWPFRDMLERRILHAKANVQQFQGNHVGSERAILFNSGHGCMVCHQQSTHPSRG